MIITRRDNAVFTVVTHLLLEMMYVTAIYVCIYVTHVYHFIIYCSIVMGFLKPGICLNVFFLGFLLFCV